MQEYLAIVAACPLFDGIGHDELRALLSCLTATQRQYEKGSYIFAAGDAVTTVGVVLAGGVNILKEDFWGNRSILAHIEPGGLFGEAFSCAQVDKLPVSAAATEKAFILLIDYRKIVSTCPSACTYHTGLIRNMVRILAQKNVALTEKIDCVSRRTTREKLLSYLSAEALRARSNAFAIPFNRQELADYLAVDRSAMSAELGRMRDEGIVRFEKNRFELAEGPPGA